MEKFFEECGVFAADDPGLQVLEEALSNVDMKVSQHDWYFFPPVVPTRNYWEFSLLSQ